VRSSISIDSARSPAAQRESTGGFEPGRGLSALQRGGASSPAPPGIGFVPLMRRVVSRSGQDRLLVAAVNPDAIANHLQQVLGEQGRSALLTDFDGQVLAGTADASPRPGRAWPRCRSSASTWRWREFGSYLGEGTRPGTQLVAFRASRTRPLVVLVETSQ
jgi:hypothetical protein